ncbi:HD domain-containing protein [Lentzea sp. BCCO 10_0856]|uniref:HD domain-containing protein n=1 Tax=Lentzea miocenica TaxID=3095431 RepID=A0ABU4T5C1_9PSEU|nr:HD domain-containing protein [Lentzea sp. BCCO 10_0856]MDX8033364.1 HD domain-containing protein [Lentzea sp. BCCO 10_0856]
MLRKAEDVLTTTDVRRRQVDERIRRLESRLVREHDEVPPSLVHEWIERASARFGDARVRDFVPLLVERAVRASVLGFSSDQHEMSGTWLPDWARNTARRLLADELPRRWAHTAGVARRARQVARVLPVEERDLLVAAAWVHDIGYAAELADTGLHSLDGARYLLRAGLSRRVCGLVAHHSGASAVAELTGMAEGLAEFGDERGRLRDALWYADMTTSPDGHPTTVEERLAEIRRRRGPDDPVVRALAINGDERLAAVRRIHRLLRRTYKPARG